MTNEELRALAITAPEFQQVSIPLNRLELDAVQEERLALEFQIEDADKLLDAAKEEYKLSVGSKKQQVKNLLTTIRSGSIVESREVFKIDDQENGVMNFYVEGRDGEAKFVTSRRLFPSERQLTTTHFIHKKETGTDGKS